MLYKIEYTIRPKGRTLFWAHRQANKKTAIADARDLLESLKEQGLKNAHVYIDGKRIYAAKSQ